MERLAYPQGEIWLYWSFVEHIKDKLLPYKDFTPEYPPLSLPFFYLSGVFGAYWFSLLFYFMVGLFITGTAFLVYRMGKNPYVFLAPVLALGTIFWDRFDIIPAFFTLLAFYFLQKNKRYIGIFILSFATLIKIYPIIFLPFFLWTKNREQILKSGLIFFIPIITIVTVTLLYGGSFNRLLSHGKRGITIESLRATPILIEQLLGKRQAVVEYKNYSYEIR